ncbi:hypothetical protein N2152v2_002065 [Parachlorella kessleri]
MEQQSSGRQQELSTPLDASLLDSLNSIVNFLHSEGFYAAEESLLREIEERFSLDASEDRPQASLGDGLAPESKQPGAEGGLEFSVPGSAQNGEVLESAEKVVEAWRSKSTTPVASPKKVQQPDLFPGRRHGHTRSESAALSDDFDEYEGEEDVGYWRLDIPGQEACLSAELDLLSNEEASPLPEATPYSTSSAPAAMCGPGAAGGSGAAATASSSLSGSPAVLPQLQIAGASQSMPVPQAHAARRLSPDFDGSGQALLSAESPSAPSMPSESAGASPRAVAPSAARLALGVGYSAFDRSAGTARWVYDRANSVGLGEFPQLWAEVPGCQPQQAQQQQQRPPLPPHHARRVSSGGLESRPSGGNDDSGSGLEAEPSAGCCVTLMEPVSLARDGHSRSSSLPLPTIAEPSLGHIVGGGEPGGQAVAVVDRPPPAAEQRRQTSSRCEEREALAAQQAPLPQQDGDLEDDCNVSRVSSLSEAMLQDALSQLAVGETAAEQSQDLDQRQQQEQQQQQQQPSLLGGQQQVVPPSQHEPPSLLERGSSSLVGFGSGMAAYGTWPQGWATSPFGGLEHSQRAAEPAALCEPAQPAGRVGQMGAPATIAEDAAAEEAAAAPLDFQVGGTSSSRQQAQQVGRKLPAVLVADPVSAGGLKGAGGVMHSRRRKSYKQRQQQAEYHRQQQQGAQRQEGAEGEEGEGGDIDYADPFTFPVTSPSEAALPEPSPLFRSWGSYKGLSFLDRKASTAYSTDDDALSYSRSRQHLMQSPMSWENIAAEEGLGAYEFDQDSFDRKYQVMALKVVARRRCTGFEESKEMPVHVGDVIAGRYQVVDLLGQAAFSRAVQALDTKTGMLVCLKIIKNNKDYFDQSLDEIRLLQYINSADPADEHGILRLYDFFYFKEHLFLVCELLRANLYEFQKHNRESGDPPYFTLPHIQSIARQVLRALAFLHSLSLIHADLKPENILIKSYSRCEVKVIDMGSSCYTSDHLSSYVQSRSYRSPEVILGAPYDQKIDIWSLGCILAELCTGRVLFQNESLPTLLARLEGILGPIPAHLLQRGRFSHKYFTRQGDIYERSRRTGRYEYLRPKRTSLRRRTGISDELMLDFLLQLLQVDPARRPSAEEALRHPWLQQEYY